MKTNKKLIGVLLVLSMLMSMFAMTAITTNATDSQPESTVVVTFTVSDIHNIRGSFEIVDNGAGVEVVSLADTGALKMSLMDKDTQKFTSVNSLDRKSTSELKLTLKLTGDVGSTAEVVFTYECVVDATDRNNLVSEERTETIPLAVVDYTNLLAAIEQADEVSKKVAQGTKYTGATYGAFATALTNANALLYKSCDSVAVEAAAKALTDAIKALVELDYSALNAALNEANSLTANDYKAENWVEFVKAWDKAKAAQNSDDQDVINTAATELTAAIAEVKKHTIDVVGDRYDEGYADGYGTGKAEGESEGKAEGESEGYNKGHAAGKAEGESEGYNAGYADGKAESETVIVESIVEVPGEKETIIVEIEGETVIVEVPGDAETVIVEVPGKDGETIIVEVPREEENNSVVWIVLFVVFLATTLGLAGLIGAHLILKKKQETDDTPVVDYNIEDDTAEDISIADDGVEENAEPAEDESDN